MRDNVIHRVAMRSLYWDMSVSAIAPRHDVPFPDEESVDRLKAALDFWEPTLSFQASLDYLVNHLNAVIRQMLPGADLPPIPCFQPWNPAELKRFCREGYPDYWRLLPERPGHDGNFATWKQHSLARAALNAVLNAAEVEDRNFRLMLGLGNSFNSGMGALDILGELRNPSKTDRWSMVLTQLLMRLCGLKVTMSDEYRNLVLLARNEDQPVVSSRVLLTQLPGELDRTRIKICGHPL